ncbi:hypothetical protein [Vibrio sinaloensis]|uniref:hypothetical protein n=1 Tax=Photobacterium sp. (strain ATCC 43367) TaxID=379097 RepID=UPI00205D4CA0|nr:hypothetical protein [Vibrio sinaloensis]UPQ90110.1 hypothetical protein MTO69_15235 [Vibrio sinaloensis]
MSWRALGLLALLVSCFSHAELSFDWDYTISSQAQAHRDSQLLGPKARSSTEQVDALLDVEVQGYDLTGLFAAKGNRIYSSDSSQSFDAELIVQELFWQSSQQVGDMPIDLTLGKVRLDWGVGYGYRPLDLFKPYRRNPVGIQVEEGVGSAMASYFDSAGEWGLVYTDSSWSQQSATTLEQAAQQQGVGLRRYWMQGDNEWQGIAYYDDVRHGLLGGSLVTVVDSAWAWHASAVYQRRYLTFVQSSAAPTELTSATSGFQALLGLNWANAMGNNIIVEYWYDNRSWSKQQWDFAFQQRTKLSSNPGTAPMAASYANGLTHANLVQHNLMFHWSLDSSSWSQWSWSQNMLWLNDFSPTIDLLYAPEDNGVIATQWLKYTLHDSGKVSFLAELAARFMTGSKQSLYANLPDKRMIFLNLRGKF